MNRKLLMPGAAVVVTLAAWSVARDRIPGWVVWRSLAPSSMPHDMPAQGTSISPPSESPDTASTLSAEQLERLVLAVGQRAELALIEEEPAWRAWKELESAGAWALEQIVQWLVHDIRELRLGSAALLVVGKPDDVALPLSRALERETEPEIRRVMVEALARLEHDDAAPALLAIWSDPAEDCRSRRSALMGLACLGHATAIAALSDPRTGAIERRLAESGRVRALQLAPDRTMIRDAVRWIAAHSPHESARLEAAEVLAP